ncbi:Maintenance of mitochondrial morphology protein 1 [Debaryomyces fabryi]|uniref:Maintenance of mitochondrial morphology protein 1 n=1 Tax=Debaryomyces fabryi TaxID=58627 RepID=A0A0V1Q0F3_9ASCO|nr:Maintenance of mitochondrial morphology protein 1 [Debaryomyces fabryi]KSA01975.1 Maintenance of mitochondrial morphology protein 1 [Debaryomyces fabryi]CUM54536.1 unnamed protein product [Debaryomyces fabryi]
MTESLVYSGTNELVNTDEENTQTAQAHFLSLEQLQMQLKAQQELFQQQRELFNNDNVHTSPIPTLNHTWSFTQGLVVGQLSVIVVVAIFIKFFVFADSSATTTTTSSSNKDISGIIVKRNKNLRGTLNEDKDLNGGKEDEYNLPNLSKISTILEKTYYDVENHSPESLDWFNVLIAQTISQLRTEALLSDNIYHSLNEFLTNLDLPDYLDKVKLTEIDIGDDFPIFSNCRIKHSKDGSGRLEAKIDVDLSDTLTLGIETRLLLNHPRPLTAVLPVQLSVSIVRFSGCLTVALINTNDQEFLDLQNVTTQSPESSNEPNSQNQSQQSTPANSSNSRVENEGSSNTEAKHSKSKKSQEETGTALMFSFSPDYRLEFTVKSLIGSRAKLQDVPKISSLIESKLRSWFIERCIEPRFQVVKVPSLWPRRQNTREPVHSNVNGIVDKTEEALI